MNAVVVTDMLRGFLEEGCRLFIGHRARRIIPNIQAVLERELAAACPASRPTRVSSASSSFSCP